MTLDELKGLIIDKPDETIYKTITANWDSIAKPVDGLGDFEKIVCKIGAINGCDKVTLDKKGHVIMCADNGIIEEGVSQSDASVTEIVAGLMGQQKSSVGIMTRMMKDLSVTTIDIGMVCEGTPEGVVPKKISRGTANFAKQKAMTSKQCLSAIQVGMDVVKELKSQGISILSTGEMGIGNTTTSTAVLAALTGKNPEDITGRGAGLTDEGLSRKKKVIAAAISKHNLESADAFDILCSVGGYDIAGLTGVFIGGALYHMPIVIDGIISAVAALVAERIKPGVREYMIPSHAGKEQGVMVALDELNLKPLILGNMALGEGTGAVMLYPLLDMVLSLYNTGTAFSSTNIDQYERYEG